MRLTSTGAIVSLWGALALVSAAQEPAEPGQNDQGTQNIRQQCGKLHQMLDDMAKTQDSDFCAAASYVLECTGDELAFPEKMKEMAAQGHPVAMLWLARSLRSGESPYQSENQPKTFRELVTAAADKGYLPAMVLAGQALYFGGDKAEERALGLEIMVRACKMGSAHARACYLVMSGLLVDKNSDLEAPEIATELKHNNFYVEEIVAEAHWDNEEWLRTASEHGSAWAAYELSLRGHIKDKESLAYLRLAAERHLPEAMTTYGCLLCLGPLPADHATQHLSSLPEKAMPQARQAETGQGADLPPMAPTAESIAEGLQLLRRATAMGDERAAAFLAMAYAAGYAGDVAPERIAALFRFAHERDLPYGTAGWGYCLVCGKGCERNVETGLELLTRMADQGVAWANIALSHLYKEGVGVEKNDDKAADYRKKFDDRPDFSPFVPTEPDAAFFPALGTPPPHE